MTKTQRKKLIEKTFTGTQVGMLLEDMQDGIKMIGEQHGELMKRIDGLDGKLDSFIVETRDNFKAVFEHLSHIEDDFIFLRKRVDRLDEEKTSIKEFNWLKSKVLEIEKRLDECKKQQTMLASRP